MGYVQGIVTFKVLKPSLRISSATALDWPISSERTESSMAPIIKSGRSVGPASLVACTPSCTLPWATPTAREPTAMVVENIFKSFSFVCHLLDSKAIAAGSAEPARADSRFIDNILRMISD